MNIKMTAEEKARNLRYKKPMLADLGCECIYDKLREIAEICGDVSYGLDDLVVDLFDDEEQAYEFQMAFSDLNTETELLLQSMDDWMNYDFESASQKFDDCSVALIGNCYDTVGYDDYQEDYYSLTGYDNQLAVSEAGKRIMRMTKADMLTEIGHVLGMILSFKNVEYKYEYLKAELDVIRGESVAVLSVIKDIEKAYADNDLKKIDTLSYSLPEKIWLE